MSRFYSSGFGGMTNERGAVVASSGRTRMPYGYGYELDDTPDEFAMPETPGGTSTRTEVRSPTSTRTEVRSPTSTSTEAYTSGNFTATVTGGAGAGANTTVNIYASPSDTSPEKSMSIPGVHHGLLIPKM